VALNKVKMKGKDNRSAVDQLDDRWPSRLISSRLNFSNGDWWARLRARTAPFQWCEPLGKRLSVGLFHVSHGIVQGVRNKTGKRAMAGPIDGIP